MSEMYLRKEKHMGFGMIVLRDYSFGRETPLIDDEIALMAENNAMHTDACRVYANRNYQGAGDFRYSLGHRGISPFPGHEVIAEFEFISLQ